MPWYSPDGVCILYIDNSNIFISAQKFAARKLGFLSGIQDFRCRINIGDLKDLACEGKQLLHGKLYGSEPPALDTVWKAIRSKQIEVHTSHKGFGAKEKETDTSLSISATDDLINYKQKVPEGIPRTFILFSGDRDMLPVVRKAEEYGWHVHVWSFKKSLSKTGILREEQQTEYVKIFYIDDHFDRLCFYEYEWRDYIPKDRTIVATFRNSVREGNSPRTKKSKVKEIVETCCEVFRIPTQYKFLRQETALALVVCAEENFISSDRDRHYKKSTVDLQQFSLLAEDAGATDVNELKAKLKQLLAECDGTIVKKEEKERKSLYEFTKDVWQKVDQLKSKLDNCVKIETAIDFFEKYTWEDFAVPDEFLDDLDQLSPEDLADFQTVQQKTKKVHKKYSEPCQYRFWCRNGAKCTYNHGETEKEYFKKTPNMMPHIRVLYKTRQCTNTPCLYREKTYLCPFAHDIEEARCLRCQLIGVHWSDECPLNF